MRTTARRRGGWRIYGVGPIALSLAMVIGMGSSPRAVAAPVPYSLFCSNPSAGDVVVNGVVTTGTMVPAKPKPGQRFVVTKYETKLRMPDVLVTAAAALKNKVVSGTSTSTVDALGATPKSIVSSKVKYSVPMPAKLPKAGVAVAFPSAPVTLGPFKATSSRITISEARQLSLTLVVSGHSLALGCLAYPDNTLPTGVTFSKPKGATVSPVIVSS